MKAISPEEARHRWPSALIFLFGSLLAVCIAFVSTPVQGAKGYDFIFLTSGLTVLPAVLYSLPRHWAALHDSRLQRRRAVASVTGTLIVAELLMFSFGLITGLSRNLVLVNMLLLAPIPMGFVLAMIQSRRN